MRSPSLRWVTENNGVVLLFLRRCSAGTTALFFPSSAGVLPDRRRCPSLPPPPSPASASGPFFCARRVLHDLDPGLSIARAYYIIMCRKFFCLKVQKSCFNIWLSGKVAVPLHPQNRGRLWASRCFLRRMRRSFIDMIP